MESFVLSVEPSGTPTGFPLAASAEPLNTGPTPHCCSKWKNNSLQWPAMQRTKMQIVLLACFCATGFHARPLNTCSCESPLRQPVTKLACETAVQDKFTHQQHHVHNAKHKMRVPLPACRKKDVPNKCVHAWLPKAAESVPRETELTFKRSPKFYGSRIGPSLADINQTQTSFASWRTVLKPYCLVGALSTHPPTKRTISRELAGR